MSVLRQTPGIVTQHKNMEGESAATAAAPGMTTLDRRTIKYEERWPQIKDFINDIITCASVSKERWNTAFFNVHNLVIAYPHSFSDRLYDDIKELLQNHTRAISKLCEECDDESLLTEYNKHWQAYYIGAEYLEQLFSQLNDGYVQGQKSSGENERGHDMKIGQLALASWRKQVIDSLCGRLTKVLMRYIQQDRNGAPVGNPIIHGIHVINSLVEVQYHEKDTFLLYEQFEAQYLKEMEKFYKKGPVSLRFVDGWPYTLQPSKHH